MVEDYSDNQPCSEDATGHLRAQIYRMVLPRKESIVKEYKRIPTESQTVAHQV